ncbi:Uncharacterised protein [Legionella steigerwaltii]|uniref:Uncharacterized protein n=1 Tax=Legionella steigerwaltii TaxID=460 RepID=A0A378LFC4_9GAMM|nr:hypothetical protein [Legionella steigerwaltii]KTD79543.1 hypothetical protein Lstg_0759 [Legionella steigerwaltii]STY24572.1 Uncharacterised protein [Legionella steigerwaltii]
MKDKIQRSNPAAITETVKQSHKMNEEVLTHLKKFGEESEAEGKSVHEQLKEYETSAETILEIHRTQIVTDASQVLITLLEKYIAQINTPLLSCSFLDHPDRKTDFILAKHCLNLLKPNHDSARTGDEAIYHLLNYLNRYHDELDIKQGTTQILCAFFSAYRHYADGLSEELTEQLAVHDFWSEVIDTRWLKPALEEIQDEDDNVKKLAFKKLAAVKTWTPENRTVHQRHLTSMMLEKLNNDTINSEAKETLIKHLTDGSDATYLELCPIDNPLRRSFLLNI